jgi:hypothetical protein
LMKASVPQPTAYSGVLFIGAVRALILGSAANKHTGQPAGMGIVVGDCKRPTEGAWPGKSRVASTGLWPAGARLAGWDLGWVGANAHGPRDFMGQLTTHDANLGQFAKCCAFRLHGNPMSWPHLCSFGRLWKNADYQCFQVHPKWTNMVLRTRKFFCLRTSVRTSGQAHWAAPREIPPAESS